MKIINRRQFAATATAAALLAAPFTASLSQAADKVTLRMSTPASETDQRSIALAEVFAPAVAAFATYQPHYNGSLIAQGAELESIASGDLEMSIASAQELATFFPNSRSSRPATSIRTRRIRSRCSAIR